MNPEQERPLTTADLANADETRRRADAQVVGRQAVAADDPSRAARNAQPQAAAAAAGAAVARRRDDSPLFAERDATELRKQWGDVQAGFVDEPRRAVQQADGLVADVMKRLAETFASERANLEHQWDRGDDVTTEDLRIALQRYRSFFDRLLAV
jgi:hypothetical protein